MVKAAAEHGWIDGDAAALELLVSIKRAGADFVLTYFARRSRRTPLVRRAGATGHAPLFERALARIPGGVDSPVRSFASVGGEPFFVARAEGAVPGRHRRPPLHRLRAVVGRVDPRARAPGGRRSGAARRGRRHVVRHADRTRGRARRGDRGRGPVGRQGAPRVVGHRGGDDRGPPRTRRDRPCEDPEVRRLLPRPHRRAARRRRQRRRHARPPRVGRRHRGHRGRHDRRPLQRRRRRSTRRSPATAPSSRR